MKNTHSTTAFKNPLVLAAAVVLTAACSPKEVPRVTHENGIPTSPVVHAPKGEKPDPQKFASLDIKTLQTQHQSGSSLQVLSQLEPYMLFATYIENPHYSSDPKTREMMRLWNRALVKAMASNPNDVANKKYFERTLTMMLSGCNDELKGCLNVLFFAQDAESSALLTTAAKQVDAKIAAGGTKMEKAERDPLVKQYYRYLLLAFDMRNRVADQELEFLYMNRAAEYAALDDTQLRPALIARHAEVFEMILLRFNPDLTNPQFRERFQGFIDNFQPWSYSRRKANLFGVGATKILALAANHFLYQQDGQLSASLRTAIDDSQKITDASAEAVEPNFAETVKYLKDSQPRLWANLKLRDDFARDEYFFMIDRLFRDHLTADDVSAIWAGAKTVKNGPSKAKHVLATAEAYIKVEVARMIARTNAYMNKSYKNKKSNATLLRDTIEQSYTLSTEWNQLLSKVDRLGILLSRQLKLSETSDLLRPGAENRMCAAKDLSDEQTYRQFEKNLTSLRRNIKYFSVYPNMMAMVFFLEEADFKITIYTWFGEYELDAADIISMFFQGMLRPFFAFGNTEEALTRLETLYAFYFALKTDTFQAFTTGDRVLDEELFFEKVIGKYLAAAKKSLEDSTQALTEKFKSSTGYSQFLENCQQDRALLAAGKRPGEGGLSISLSFERDFYEATYMGGGYAGMTVTAFDYYTDTGGPTSALGNIRKLLRKRINFVEAMVAILDSHLKQTEPDAAKRDAKIQRIRANLAAVEKSKREFLTEAYKRHQEVSSCLMQTMKIEQNRQAELIRLEEQHLRDVYREMQALKGLQGADLAAREQDLNRRMREKYPLVLPGDQMPDGFNGVGQVTASEYQYASLDVRLRMRAYLGRLAPNMRISLPTNLADTDIYKQRQLMTISGRLSEDLFVAQGLRALGRGSGSYLNWVSRASSLSTLKTRILLIGELHKLGTFEIYDYQSPECASSQDVTKCPLKSITVSADDVVDALGETIEHISLTKNGQKTAYAQALELTGLPGLYSRSDLVDFMFDKQGSRLTFAEWIYNNFVFDNDDLKEAKEYYMTETGTGHFLFAPDKSVSTSLRSRFRPLVMNYFATVDGLKAAIDRREEKDKAAGAQRWELGYELRPGSAPLIIGAPVDGDKPVYLNPARARDFVARKNLFTRETNNEFRPKKGDPDYDPTKHKDEAEAACK